jgi:hypothetical protein
LHIHAHIERCIEANGEASFFTVELMTAYAQVGQYAIHFFNTEQAKPIRHKAEVLIDEFEARVGVIKRPALAAFTRAELPRWGEIIRGAGMRLD